MRKIITLSTLIFAINIQAQIITTIAGNGINGYSGDGGAATATKLSLPYGIGSDAVGNIYIADLDNSRIRKVNTAGIISTVAGNGTAGFSGDGGQATDAELNSPRAICFDALGNFYIADELNYRIRKVNSAGIITTLAGNGNDGFSGDGGQATASELSNAFGIAIDALGNLYMADWGNGRIRKVNTAGIISTYAGNGLCCAIGDGGQATAAQLSYPYGVALDTIGNLYIANYGDGRVRMVNTSGIITTIAGGGSSLAEGVAATNAYLSGPNSVAIDITGNLYISEYYNARIRIVNTSGIINTIAGNETSGFSGDGGQAIAAELNYPTGIVINIAGNLYIADQSNNRIRMVTNATTLGITKFNKEEQTLIYPNPSNGNFIIETNATTKQTLQVYDVNGRVVLTQTIQPTPNPSKEGNSIAVDASNLPSGIYNVSVISNEGVANKRLVIAR